jgi:hypothetical protein
MSNTAQHAHILVIVGRTDNAHATINVVTRFVDVGVGPLCAQKRKSYADIEFCQF